MHGASCLPMATSLVEAALLGATSLTLGSPIYTVLDTPAFKASATGARGLSLLATSGQALLNSAAGESENGEASLMMRS